MSKDQYVAASPEKLSEIIREAESYLNAQTQLGIAADQRAMTLAGILATAEAALIAWASTRGWSDKGFVAILVLMAGLLVAVGLALFSARPKA